MQIKSTEISHLDSQGDVIDAIKALSSNEWLTMLGKSEQLIVAQCDSVGSIMVEHQFIDTDFGELVIRHIPQGLSKAELKVLLLEFQAWPGSENSPVFRGGYDWKIGPLTALQLQSVQEDVIALLHAKQGEDMSATSQNQSCNEIAPPVATISLAEPKSQKQPSTLSDLNHWGWSLNEKIRCPYCSNSGFVYVGKGSRKKGVSGGKATAAILTAGVSLLAFGLSRQEKVNCFVCKNCDMEWNAET